MRPASRRNMENSTWKEKAGSAGPEPQDSGSADAVETRDGHIGMFVQQNSPVNNELARNPSLNDLSGQNSTDRRYPILLTGVKVREKKGRMPAVVSMCSFSYNDSVKFDDYGAMGIEITGYDRRVYNAVGTLWMNRHKEVSPTEIFSVMNGYVKANPSSRQLKAIEGSLEKLNKVRFYIDITGEVNANLIKDRDVLVNAGILEGKKGKAKKAVIKDNLLNYRAGMAIGRQGKTYRSIELTSEPALLTYNRAKGTLLSIPMKYIGLAGTNMTEKAIAFQDYLLMRIIGYRNGRMQENKILYDTLYRNSGIGRPEHSRDFIRDRETVRKMLEEWKEKGLINGYEEIKEGRSFAGVVLDVDMPMETGGKRGKSGK